MRVLVIAALAGCGFQHGGGAGADSGVVGDGRDAMVGIDAPVAPPDALECFGAGTFEVCVHPAPSGALVLPASINTDTSLACLTAQPAGWAGNGQPASCIIAADSIAVNALVTVTGTRPLVLVAASTITISATLDVASYVSAKTGPGSAGSATRCTAFGVLPPAVDSNGGGGGAGGSYGTLGGNGGNGNGINNTSGTTNNPVTTPTVLRAGCDGQRGGDGASNNTGGEPGHGGGAVYLVAGSTITLNALSVINASGGGSPAGGTASGAGGAGSGGTIILWAPTINATGAVVMANGGGGASGGNSAMNGHGGNAGANPNPALPFTPALGATGPTAGGGGIGGAGFAEPNQAGPGGNGGTNQGGGGGGGGAGYILTNAPLAFAAAAVTPPADTIP